MTNPEDFDAVVSAFNFPNFSYADSLSNAYRINYTPRVFSANEAPSDITIFLHHEMAQTPIYPSKLFFFCQTAADEGGATPICRSDVLWKRLCEQCPDFAEACRVRGLKYSNVMPAETDESSGMGRSWQSTFSVDTREAAEARLAKLAGYQINGGLMCLAKPEALVMHCLPAYRGKEIDAETFEAHADTIFTQAENRLHTQKAILAWLAG